jgi:hypothetical protein
MPRRAPADQQIALVVDDTAIALRRAMKAVRERAGLADAELGALELAVGAYLAEVEGKRPVTKSDTPKLIGAWLTEYKAATGEPSPRLTGNEAHVLTNVAKRCANDVERACELIRAFWPWRASMIEQGAAAPQATPFGLQKHLASITAWLGEQKKRKAPPAASVARELEREQEAALASPPDPVQVRKFVRDLARGKGER